MQAFLWRHLVPAAEFQVRVADTADRVPARPAPVRPPKPSPTNTVTLASATSTNDLPNKPKFSKQQVAGRLRTLKLLYEEGLLTDEFYDAKVSECEAVQ
jgi:hypothetical protein